MGDVTLGIDLASQPKKTAVCALRWNGGRPTVVLCEVGRVNGAALTDDNLLSLIRGGASHGVVPVKVAIDAPFGWPVSFVQAMRDPIVFAEALGSTRRKHLERRATDHWVHDREGKQPLSVTTDRIAYCAMRTAGLLSALAKEAPASVDRTGVGGLVCEAYPDPAIRRFRLRPTGRRPSYKGADAGAERSRIVGALAKEIAMSNDVMGLCLNSDDALDAVVCALVARAAQRQLTVPPPPDHQDVATTEGWIHLPAEDMSISALR